MTIASLPFLGFVILVALVYNLARPAWWRQGILLVANAAFLVTFATGVVPLLPLLGFLVAGYAAVWMVQRGVSGGAYAAVMVALIVMFFWLKRYSFLPAASFLPFVYSVIGLSYIFFRVLHMIIDSHSGDLAERVGPVAYLNYTLNFTSLVSGPIQRYQDYAAMQIGPTRPPLDWRAVGLALERASTGLFKVVVLAAILYAWHQSMLLDFADQTTLGSQVLVAAGLMVTYTFYLYCNFSGYTDLVIGAARFYRLILPENFDHPFSATSFIDFWTRWHMTLSEWLKTYVYNPLVLALIGRFPSAQAAPFLGVFAFFVTFFLIGLWHGQTSIFAVYGVLLGLGVSVNKLYQVEMARRLGRKPYRALTQRLWYQALGRGLTFTWFNISLVCFWGSWPIVGSLLGRLGAAGTMGVSLMMIAGGGALLSLGVLARDACLGIRLFGTPIVQSRYTRTICVTVMGATALAALALLASPAPDIVYKEF